MLKFCIYKHSCLPHAAADAPACTRIVFPKQNVLLLIRVVSGLKTHTYSNIISTIERVRGDGCCFEHLQCKSQ